MSKKKNSKKRASRKNNDNIKAASQENAKTVKNTSVKKATEKKKKQSIKERFTKMNLFSGLVVCFALGFTVCLFSPVDIFLSSKEEFFVGFKTILLPMILTSLLMTTVLAIIALIALAINETFYKLVRNLMLGGLIAMYAQMVFMNGAMTQLTGDSNDYREISVRNCANLAVFILIAFVPVILWRLKAKFPDKPLLVKLSDKTVAYVAGLLAVVQIVGNISTIATSGPGLFSDDSISLMLSYKGAMQLSPDENVIVLLTDRLDDIYMDEVLEEYPEIKETLEGFTYYHNNIAKYTNTFPSTAEMLSGVEYNREKRGEYLASAWKSDNMLKTLHDSGIRVNAIADITTTFLSTSYVKGFVDNCEDFDLDYDVNYIGSNGVVITMLKLSALKLLPYFGKAVPAHFMNKWQPDDFYTINSDTSDAMKGVVSAKADVEFYNYLKDVGLNTTSEEKTFNFIHLNAFHGKHAELAKLVPSYDEEKDDLSVNASGRGAFVIINEYFNQLKDLGIYDNSTIVILGDHGRPPWAIQKGAEELDDSITTGLLIKRANAPHDELKIDNDSALSNALFTSSILSFFGIDNSEYGPSYDDVIADKSDPDRIIHIYNYKGSNLAPEFVCSYKVTGDAHDFGNWEYIK